MSGSHNETWDEFVRGLDARLIDGKISAEDHARLANGPRSIYEWLSALRCRYCSKANDKDSLVLPSTERVEDMFAMDVRAFGLTPSDHRKDMTSWYKPTYAEVIAAATDDGRYRLGTLSDLLPFGEHCLQEVDVVIAALDPSSKRVYWLYTMEKNGMSTSHYLNSTYKDDAAFIVRDDVSAVRLLVVRK